MVKLSGTIRPTQTQHVEAEGDSYEEAKATLEASVPEGWQLITILNER